MAPKSPEFRQYQAALGRLAADAFPKAIAETLNVVAGFAHAAQAETRLPAITPEPAEAQE